MNLKTTHIIAIVFLCFLNMSAQRIPVESLRYFDYCGTKEDAKATAKILKAKGFKVNRMEDHFRVTDASGKTGIYTFDGRKCLDCVAPDAKSLISEKRIGGCGFFQVANMGCVTPEGRLIVPETLRLENFGFKVEDKIMLQVSRGLSLSESQKYGCYRLYGVYSLEGDVILEPEYKEINLLTIGEKTYLHAIRSQKTSLIADASGKIMSEIKGVGIKIDKDFFDTEVGRVYVCHITDSGVGAAFTDDFRLVVPWTECLDISCIRQSYRTLFASSPHLPYSDKDAFGKIQDAVIRDINGNELFTISGKREIYPLPNDYFLLYDYEAGNYGSFGLLLDNNFNKIKNLGKVSPPTGKNKSLAYLKVFDAEGNYEDFGYTFRGELISLKDSDGKILADDHAVASRSNALVVGKKTVAKELPSLEIVPGSLRFVDVSGHNAIESGGSYAIEFAVTNNGKGEARGCRPVMNVRGKGVRLNAPDIFDILPGATKTVSATVTASDDTADGQAEFSVSVDEDNGFGTDTQCLVVNTHAFEAPMLVVNDYNITGTGQSATLQKKVPFDLQVLVQNVTHGAAEDVGISISLPDNVFVVEGEENTRVARMDGGEVKSLVYTIVANNRYAADKIPVTVSVSEKYGRYGRSRTIDLYLSQPLSVSKIAVDEHRGERREIELASLTSDVDRDIPAGSRKSPATFAVIIANETYSQVATVPHALNDGKIFAEYCRNTLGIPTENIRNIYNATRNDMVRQLNWLREIGAAYGKDASIIFYYSGHGVPSETDRSSYLMPVDGYHSDMGTNLALEEVYSTLGELGAGNVTVFLDACFSGSERGDNMLVAARGVRLKSRSGVPKGNMVVFSASQGDETAYPLDSERHGMFTYFLLKKLKETAGEITLGELGDYIIGEVRRKSVVENSRSQTPAVLTSPDIADTWRSHRL